MTSIPTRTGLAILTAALALVACGTPQAPSDAAVPPVAEEVEADQPAVEALAVSGPGSLDPAYKPNFGGFGSLNNLATHVKALPNGKNLVVFQLRSGSDFFDQHIVVRRYNADGTLDRTFGQSGAVGIRDVSGGSKTLTPEAISVAPDGRIFIAATGSNPTWTTQNIVRPIIFALTPGGGFDPGFDDNGQFYPASKQYPLTVGSALNQTSAADLAYDPVTRRLTLGGTIDPSNGRSFFWTLTFGVDQTTFAKERFVKESGSDLRLREIERLPSGELVMAGELSPAGGGSLPTPYLARQLDNGLVLGKRPVSIGQGAFVGGLKLDGGKVLLAGTSFPSGLNTQGFVARLSLDSLFLDPAFGVGGVRFVSKEVRALAVAKDHRLVVVGGAGSGKGIMAARLTAGGGLDPSFGTGGIALPLKLNTPDSTEFANAVDLDSQGRILLGGLSKRPGVNDRNHVARLLP